MPWQPAMYIWKNLPTEQSKKSAVVGRHYLLIWITWVGNKIGCICALQKLWCSFKCLGLLSGVLNFYWESLPLGKKQLSAPFLEKSSLLCCAILILIMSQYNTLPRSSSILKSECFSVRRGRICILVVGQAGPCMGSREGVIIECPLIHLFHDIIFYGG